MNTSELNFAARIVQSVKTKEMTLLILYFAIKVITYGKGKFVIGFLLGYACFPEILQNFSERQILWSLCLEVFLVLALRSPIQTSLSVTPKLQVSGSSTKRVHPWFIYSPQLYFSPIFLLF